MGQQGQEDSHLKGWGQMVEGEYENSNTEVAEVPLSPLPLQ